MPQEDVLDKETVTFNVRSDLSHLTHFFSPRHCCSLRSTRLSLLLAAETWSVIPGSVIRVVLMAVLTRKEYTFSSLTVHKF